MAHPCSRLPLQGQSWWAAGRELAPTNCRPSGTTFGPLKPCSIQVPWGWVTREPLAPEGVGTQSEHLEVGMDGGGIWRASLEASPGTPTPACPAGVGPQTRHPLPAVKTFQPSSRLSRQPGLQVQSSLFLSTPCPTHTPSFSVSRMIISGCVNIKDHHLEPFRIFFLLSLWISSPVSTHLAQEGDRPPSPGGFVTQQQLANPASPARRAPTAKGPPLVTQIPASDGSSALPGRHPIPHPSSVPPTPHFWACVGSAPPLQRGGPVSTEEASLALGRMKLFQRSRATTLQRGKQRLRDTCTGASHGVAVGPRGSPAWEAPFP